MTIIQPEAPEDINTLREFVGGLQNAKIKRTLNEISDEEKGHSEHLTRLLLMLDKNKYDGLES